MTFCQNNCMKFKRRSLSITKTIKYSINQASRNIFFEVSWMFLHIFLVLFFSYFWCNRADTTLRRPRSQNEMVPRDMIHIYNKGRPLKGLSNLEKKKKKKKKKPVAVAGPSTITCCRESLDRPVRHILSWRFGHENIATTIILFRWFQQSSCQLMEKEFSLSTG